MASGPTTSWQIEGEKVEVVTDILFLGSKITADGDCNLEIRRWLLLVRKAMTNLFSVLKSRDITLLTNVCIVKAMVFPVVMYNCESWTVKKAEHQRIDVFELCCWERLLKVPWTARRSDQSMLTDQPWTLFGRTDAETEAIVISPYDGDSWLIGKVPDAGKGWGQEKKVSEDEMAGQHHQCNGHELGTLREMVMDREAWRVAVHGVPERRTWLGDGTPTTVQNMWQMFFPSLLFVF